MDKGKVEVFDYNQANKPAYIVLPLVFWKPVSMREPDIPNNEQERLRALQSLCLLDSPPEPEFDQITQATQDFFKVPICLVSLVDKDRQWFKSNQGLDAQETPRVVSFCGHTINFDDIFYVPDTMDDCRFRTNPLVTGPPNIRFYAGAPLNVSEGLNVGTLCIIDQKTTRFF